MKRLSMGFYFTFTIVLCASLFSFAQNVSSNNSEDLVQEDIFPEFAPAQFIVKFKSDGKFAITEDVSSTLASKISFRNASPSKSDSLDHLNSKFKIKSARSLLIPREGLDIVQARILQDEKMSFISNRYAAKGSRSIDSESIPDLTNIYLLETEGSVDILKAIKEYSEDLHVEYAQPNYRVKTVFKPNDPYYQSAGSWGQDYDDLWGLKKIEVEKALDISEGEGVIVAVVDTGVDYTHPDIVNNLLINEEEVPDNGIDDDNNGFIDDYYGVNFSDGSGDPFDGNGHGTHVAGTIAAEGNNDLGVVGVSPKSKILAIKSLDDGGSGLLSDLGDGMYFAYQKGADIINNSWGCSSACPSSAYIEDIVRIGYTLGVINVFAAGNSGSNVGLFSPQNMFETITVSAFDYTDHMASFSNFGGGVDVAAPGVDILSLNSNRGNNSIALERPDLVVGTDYLRLNGTSMAAPHVSGLAALILSKNPDLSIEEVRSVIRNSADDVDEEGFDHNSGAGRINAYQAVQTESFCSANIISPFSDDSIFKVDNISIYGIATCRNFDHYELEVGEGRKPVEWASIYSSTSPVVNLSNPLVIWNPSDFSDGTYVLRLKVFSTSGESYSSETIIHLITLHEGWPQPAGDFIIRSAVLGDLDSDGLNDIVYSTQFLNNKIFALKHDGSSVFGWPKDCDDLIAGSDVSEVTVGDVDGNGSLEVIAGCSNYLFVFSANGDVLSGWPVGLKQSIGSKNGSWRLKNAPILTDLDKDGVNEIIVVSEGTLSYAEYLHVFDGQGNDKPGWPKALLLKEQEGLTSGSAANMIMGSADMSGNGFDEIVICQSSKDTDDGIDKTMCAIYDYEGNVLSGWPIEIINDQVVQALALGDLTGDGVPEIIFTSGSGNVHVLKSDGSYLEGWPKAMNFSPRGSLSFPTLADFDGDRIAEIAIAFTKIERDDEGAFRSVSSFLAVLNADGSFFPGWPIEVPYITSGPPLVADVNGDKKSDLVGGAKETVYAFNTEGQMLDGWPKPITYGTSMPGPVIGDMDGDSNLELLVGGAGSKLFLYDIPAEVNSDTTQWPMWGNNSRRTALWTPPPLPPCYPPDNLSPSETVTADANGKISLSWDPVEDAIAYGVRLDDGVDDQYYDDPRFNSPVHCTPGAHYYCEDGVTTTEITQVPVLEGRTYEFWVDPVYEDPRNYCNGYTTFYVEEPAVGPSVMKSPAPGSTLPGSSVSFTWKQNEATQNYLQVITQQNHYVYSGYADSGITVSDIPQYGTPITVRLYSVINGNWHYPAGEYTYQTNPVDELPEPSVMLIPQVGDTLTASQTFTWDEGVGVDKHYLYMYTTNSSGGYVYPYRGETNSGVSVSGIPQNGQIVHVYLYSIMQSGQWMSKYYSYTADIPMKSCKEILDDSQTGYGSSVGSGTYTIDPDGSGGNAPFAAYCDMTTGGGGWTLVVGIDGENKNHYNNAAVTSNNLSSLTGKGKFSDTVINQIRTAGSGQLSLRIGTTTTPDMTQVFNGCNFNATATASGSCTQNISWGSAKGLMIRNYSSGKARDKAYYTTVDWGCRTHDGGYSAGGGCQEGTVWAR